MTDLYCQLFIVPVKGPSGIFSAIEIVLRPERRKHANLRRVNDLRTALARVNSSATPVAPR